MPKKKQRQRPTRSTPPRQSTESRAAEAVTVGWMLCTLATLLAMLATLVARLIAYLSGDAPETRMASAVLFFAAVVAGVVSLTLAAAAHRLRRDPPPRSVSLTAIGIAALPLRIMGIQALWR